MSILFVDLVVVHGLSEGRDPEEVQELLARYFEVCRTIIARYGGTVEKFIGDAVMAMWGAPVAHEDDAERAVRAARRARRRGRGGRRTSSACRSSPPGPASSAARPRSRSGRSARGWSPATSSTPRRGSRPPPGRAPSSSTRRPTGRFEVRSRSSGPATARSVASGCRSRPGRRARSWRAGGLGRSVLPEGPLVGRESALGDRQGPPCRASARNGRSGSCRSSARPGWARAGSAGSSRSTSTASSS